MTSRHYRTSALMAMLVAAGSLSAQGVNAQLSGTVRSKSGDPLAAAVVAIRNSETGLTRNVQTDANGRFLAAALPVGPYNVTVTKTGFQPATNLKVNLNLGDAAPLAVKLAPEAGTTVEVIAAYSAVDSERTSAATLISPDALVNLPILNRGFIGFAQLTPQVQVDSARGNLAIAGQRGVNTSINIDGGDYNQAFFGGMTGAAENKTPFTVSIEAIREFQVITDGSSAEFGRMGGGMVNAITKSGTNELTGSLFYYARPRNLVAKDHQTGLEIADFKQTQYGFSLGGPIVKDKLFYFVAFDGQRRTDPLQFAWGGTNPLPGLYPLNPAVAADAALIARDGQYSTKADSNTTFARLDWILGTDHTLQFRVNKSNFTGNVGAGISNAKESVSSDDIKTTSFVAQWNWTIGSNWINEFRINKVDDDQPRVASSQKPQVSITNVGTYGSQINFEREFTTKRTQITETLTYVNPTLQVKGGLDLNTTKVAEVFASTQYGSYSFNNIADFRAGNWNTFQQRFSLLPGGTARDSGTFDQSEREISAFLQADWRASNSLKVGLGLRWDRQEHPAFAIADLSNPLAATMPVTAKIPTDSQFSPRLSFTWTPENDQGRTVVRGSVGRYVSRTPSVFLFQAYAENGVRAARITFTSAQAGTFGIPRGAGFTANDPYRLPSLPVGASLPALDVFSYDQNFKNPYTDRLNLGGERAYGDWVLGLSGAYAKGEQMERLRDINLPTPIKNAQGREVFSSVRPNPLFRALMAYTSDGSSTYSALTLSAKYQKDQSPFAAQFFYTFAQNRDNDSNERNFSAFEAQNTQRLSDEWSWAASDRRSTLTGYLSYFEQKWTGLQFGFNVRYLSGSPYSVTNGNDLNNDGIRGNDRLIGTERNSFRRAATTIVDLKVSRDWKLGRSRFTLSGEVFNLLNHVERFAQTRFSGTDAAPVVTFNTQLAVSNHRQVQLGARLAF